MAVALPIYAQRLREARLRTGLSQKALGLLVGMDPGTASPRMNQYERGKREPDLLTFSALAMALNVPLAFFYCEDDGLAGVLLAWQQLPAKRRKAAVAAMLESVESKLSG
jgi:transcriptional regulator with XRE-family HTH domain